MAEMKMWAGLELLEGRNKLAGRQVSDLGACGKQRLLL